MRGEHVCALAGASVAKRVSPGDVVDDAKGHVRGHCVADLGIRGVAVVVYGHMLYTDEELVF